MHFIAITSHIEEKKGRWKKIIFENQKKRAKIGSRGEVRKTKADDKAGYSRRTGSMRMTDKQHEQTQAKPSLKEIKQAVQQHFDCQGSY